MQTSGNPIGDADGSRIHIKFELHMQKSARPKSGGRYENLHCVRFRRGHSVPLLGTEWALSRAPIKYSARFELRRSALWRHGIVHNRYGLDTILRHFRRGHFFRSNASKDQDKVRRENHGKGHRR